MNTVDKAIRAHYDGYYGSATLAEWRRLGAIDKAKNVVDLCDGLVAGKILEVGCGEGAVIRRLSSMGFGSNHFGIDISESAIESARSATKGSDISFQKFDGSVIPFGDEQFDVVILSHVVEHLEDPRALLKEARRVARHVVVEVPCEHTFRLARDYVPDPVGHINFYTPVTIRRLLQTTGLVVEKQITRGCSLDVMRFGGQRFGYLKYLIRELTLRLSPRLAPAVFVYHTAILCR